MVMFFPPVSFFAPSPLMTTRLHDDVSLGHVPPPKASNLAPTGPPPPPHLEAPAHIICKDLLYLYPSHCALHMAAYRDCVPSVTYSEAASYLKPEGQFLYSGPGIIRLGGGGRGCVSISYATA